MEDQGGCQVRQREDEAKCLEKNKESKDEMGEEQRTHRRTGRDAIFPKKIPLPFKSNTGHLRSASIRRRVSETNNALYRLMQDQTTKLQEQKTLVERQREENKKIKDQLENISIHAHKFTEEDRELWKDIERLQTDLDQIRRQLNGTWNMMDTAQHCWDFLKDRTDNSDMAKSHTQKRDHSEELVELPLTIENRLSSGDMDRELWYPDHLRPSTSASSCHADLHDHWEVCFATKRCEEVNP